MSNVMFLGWQHSGKTVLMAALSRAFDRAGGKRFGLEPKTEATYCFSETILGKLSQGEWPSATPNNAFEAFSWDLVNNHDVLANLTFHDFGGEVLSLLTSEAPVSDADSNVMRAAKQVVAEMQKADHCFLLFNKGDMACSDPKWVKARYGFCNLVAYLRKLPTHPRITVLMTQADRYCENPETVNARELFLGTNDIFWKKGLDSLEVIAVSAVGKTTRDVSGFEVPDPQYAGPVNFRPLLLEILRGSIVEEHLGKIAQAAKDAKRLLAEEPRPGYHSSHYASVSKTLHEMPEAFNAAVETYGFLLLESDRQELFALARAIPQHIVKLLKCFKDAQEEEKRQAEAEARRKAEEARRRAEEARRRAEEARKKAEEERRRAEEEARRKAEEARRQAEEARKKAEEERRRAEAEAKRKVEEATRQKAEEKARKLRELKEWARQTFQGAIEAVLLSTAFYYKETPPPSLGGFLKRLEHRLEHLQDVLGHDVVQTLPSESLAHAGRIVSDTTTIVKRLKQLQDALSIALNTSARIRRTDEHWATLVSKFPIAFVPKLVQRLQQSARACRLLG